MFWCFGWEACGILAPQSEIKPAPSVLEGEILTTGCLIDLYRTDGREVIIE